MKKSNHSGFYSTGYSSFPLNFENQDDVFLRLDFSAIAKGYGVDAIAEALYKLELRII